MGVIGLLMSMACADDGILIKNGQKIAFLGDSITAGGWSSPGGYVRLIVNGLEKNGVKVESIPAGVSGNKSNDMLARLDRDVLSKNPDWMTLSCGVNDVWHGSKGVPLDAYKKNITAIVDQAQTKGVKVMLLTATPIGEEMNDNNKKLAEYNDFLRQLAKERGLPLADLNADFREHLKNLPTTPQSRFLTVDGVHMNPDGNVIMAKGCLRALGVSVAEVEKMEEDWLKQPDMAQVSIGVYDPKPDLQITLAEFRALKKMAEGMNISSVELCKDLWMRAYAEVIQSHSKEPLINVESIKKEVNAILLVKIQEKLKASK